MEDKSAYRKAKRVTWLGVCINTLLSVVKLVVGYLGHSQALVADGVHSLSDILTDFMVLFAARAHHRGPDEDHPYGHGRFETVTTVILAVILLFVGLGIGFESLSHLLFSTDLWVPNVLVLVVALVSVIANEILFRLTRKVAIAVQSDMLLANAWHSRSDALSSLVVLIGAFASYIGLTWGDAIAAIIVALLILKMALKMIWRNLQELVDTGVSEKTRARYEAIIQAVPGVIALHQLRSRLLAGQVYLDVHVQVAPKISVSEGHFISDQVMQTLRKQFSQVKDVTVHIDPEDDEKILKPRMSLPSRQTLVTCLLAHRADLPGFEGDAQVSLHYLDHALFVNICLPLSMLDQYSVDSLVEKYTAVLKTCHQSVTCHLFFSATV